MFYGQLRDTISPVCPVGPRLSCQLYMSKTPHLEGIHVGLKSCPRTTTSTTRSFDERNGKYTLNPSQMTELLNLIPDTLQRKLISTACIYPSLLCHYPQLAGKERVDQSVNCQCYFHSVSITADTVPIHPSPSRHANLTSAPTLGTL